MTAKCERCGINPRITSKTALCVGCGKQLCEECVGNICKEDSIEVSRGNIQPGDPDYEVCPKHGSTSIWGCLGCKAETETQ